jgi:acylglycerol lipase
MMHMFTTDHTPLLYGKDKPPVPTDLPSNQRGEFIRSSDDRLWLFQRQWIPSQPILATLLILHGTVDHSGAYHDLATLLNRAGIAVFCTDMRGWGLSDGESYYFHNVQVFENDVREQQEHICQEYPDVKYHFLLGKSIGGLIAAHACCSSNVHVNGFIALSGAFGIDESMIPSGPILVLLHTLNMVMPKLALKPIMSVDLLVTDESAQNEWGNDPLVRRERLTVGYVNELLHCKGQIEKFLQESFPRHLPVLALWGTDDKVVTKQGHDVLCGFSENATLKTYTGGRHNLLYEPKLKMQVMSDIRDWIIENCSK